MCENEEQIKQIILMDNLEETQARTAANEAFRYIFSYLINYDEFENIENIRLILGNGEYIYKVDNKVDNEGKSEKKIEEKNKHPENGFSNGKYKELFEKIKKEINEKKLATLLMLDSALDEENRNLDDGRKRSDWILSQAFKEWGDDKTTRVIVILYSGLFDDKYKEKMKKEYKDLILVDSSMDNPEDMAFQIVKEVGNYESIYTD